ncbi:hypothetical protein C8N25_115129 [Algoriphagus antarcticus]|uniref:6-bladed beta-propeller protein n=2 Tax=Algoriphagus antarcticus TaxID=238540 RepID=A0A3E0DP74_9BACT|nr:hypothetical protein C8N25_115129 [Algoriphagus antarcticus]
MIVKQALFELLKNFVRMRLLILLLSLSIIHFGCRRGGNESLANEYHFELVDTLQINLMYEFGFVTKSMVDGYMLVYTYHDGVFHLINSTGKVQKSIDRKGEGPREYNRNLPFATIFNKMIVFMDTRKLIFYDLNGEWVKSVSYHNLGSLGQIGIPESDLLFIDSGRFVVPNQKIVDLPNVSGHLTMLDTIPLWIEYKFSDITGKYEKANVGFMDTTGILYSSLKYLNYKSMMWFQDGFLCQIPQLTDIIYRYEVGRSLYPLDKVSLKIPNFKDPIGLEVEALTVDNYQFFNKSAAVNSFINYVVPMENGSFFAIYSTGLSEFEYDKLIEDAKPPEGEFYGYYFDNILSEGHRVHLPQNGVHPSFWKKVTYLGQGRFLFVYDNEIERDYYIGGVFGLKKM